LNVRVFAFFLLAMSMAGCRAISDAPAEGIAFPLPGVHIAEKEVPLEYIQDIERAARINAGVIRVPVDWASLEPEPGQFDSTYLEEVRERVMEAHGRGIQVILMFAQSPPWANGNNDPPFPPLPSHYGDYARALLHLYSSIPEAYRGNVLALEVWNEPNSIEFWPTYAQPREGTFVLVPLEAAGEYAGLLDSAYRIVKDSFPDVRILGGSLASADTQYLRILLNHNAGRGIMDALSVHPYARVDEVDSTHYGYAQYPDQCNESDPLSPPWCFQQGLESIFHILEEYGIRDMEIWITEFGVSSGYGWGDAGGEEEQMKHLEIALDILDGWAVEGRGNIKAFVWYRLRDEVEDSFGLYREDGTLKPAGQLFGQRANR